MRYKIYKQNPDPPYMVYYIEGTENFAADDSAYKKAYDIVVDLYTAKKDITTENKIESALTDSGIYWNIDNEDYIDDLDYFMITYTFRIIN